ncbi:asialoglycoprotein receptor 1-like isoform X2 [Rhineura floridana]|uniref:asialoglycoprotein receptor 1-like isoform X2 n=1 Tax=Rhineura floridana TaxID=261503 RepID=UPI002AC89052|nr:asialoglycoprotein receptor 1-like isoform X2 [Rhineura floridana]
MEDKYEVQGRSEFGPHQSYSWRQRVCPGHRLVFALLGLVCIFTVTIAVFGLTGRKIGTDLRGMQGDLKSVNRTVFVELAALKNKEADDLKTLVKIDHLVQNLTEEVKEVKTQFHDQISKLRINIRTQNCNLENAKRNQTDSHCCPKGWHSFSRSCYWISTTDKPWDDARVDCEDKDSHLVILTSYSEQQFVTQLAKPRYTWIGLTLTSGSWKWVDGTAYTVRRM